MRRISSEFRPRPLARAIALAGLSALCLPALAQEKANPVCPVEKAFYNPGNGEDIVVPQGYKVEVWAKDLNFPTDIAFVGDAKRFNAYVLESGTGVPSACNNNALVPGVDRYAPNNPFTSNLLVLDRQGQRIGGPLGKPTPQGGGFQPDGPAIGLAFEYGARGGRLFVTDSNQSARTGPGAGNNSSRISTIHPVTGQLTPFITGLPTGDHPTEQITVKGSWIYWSQGSATNSGVVGRDNGGGANQHDIACQDIKLGANTFDSGGGVSTSGYSTFGTVRPGATVRAFEGATARGMCTGAILRARIHAGNPQGTIEPVSWGYRNPYGLRFSPEDHPLRGDLLVTENGEDERGARPVNNSPDRLQIARQNKNGTPDYHGWPDRFGYFDSTQALFNPVGGPADDNAAAVIGKPVPAVLAFPPQPIVAPLANLPDNVASVGLDFAPRAFTGGVVKRGAALVAREGDFGFSARNGTPIEGHDVMLVNFSKTLPLQISTSRFAFNCRQADQRVGPDGSAACAHPLGQAFPNQLRGVNRPTTAVFGPDGALYVVDYGAVRDFGRSGEGSAFVSPADAPLVQIPGTGVIWRISRTAQSGGRQAEDRDDD
ncbi:MAG: hypothetical protein Q8K38_01895 [Burkholderiaceae bacterium]|uniref:hypothetical protein n=1 Tax=Hydrogenophaga sp. TaxID=1904254 RepID=UPI00276BB99D|nr:hypothetical protein [Hydrogenophaga sp.]MDP2064707.1 hypothetical protein [Burkholderiaceae bacterium]MDZ4144579.1 hypothetical protein [Burkholderiales bacterium]MDZ4399506.1 hypothetical protein [Hydrogenophaga sp.]